MTIVEQPAVRDLVPVTVDLYRDIHKAIRAELFALTSGAAALDPADVVGRQALAAHVSDTTTLLASHAEHEETGVQPAIEAHLPDLAERVVADHRSLDAQFVQVEELAAEAAAVEVADPRFALHRLHLAVARFTGAYLAHQDLEETSVMPALEAAIGIEAVAAIHGGIVAAIPPAEMARSLALMLPAMNVDDRTELLGGMKAHAPAEAFAGVWSLAGSVLRPADVAVLGTRLGL